MFVHVLVHIERRIPEMPARQYCRRYRSPGEVFAYLGVWPLCFVPYHLVRCVRFHFFRLRFEAVHRAGVATCQLCSGASQLLHAVKDSCMGMPEVHSRRIGIVLEGESNCRAVARCCCFVSAGRICSYRPTAGWAADRGQSRRVSSKRISATVGDLRTLGEGVYMMLAV